MYIKDALELLHEGFSVDEIRAMDKEQPKETEKPSDNETVTEKTPQPAAQPTENESTAAHKTVDDAQPTTDDLNKEIEDLKAQLKAAQDLNNKTGVPADTPKEKTAEDIISNFLHEL
jgi:DNA-binding transcriptional MerR regulator